MAAAPTAHRCPHCRKEFQADLLGSKSKHAGYKCPHCNLFVPISRAAA